MAISVATAQMLKFWIHQFFIQVEWWSMLGSRRVLCSDLPYSSGHTPNTRNSNLPLCRWYRHHSQQRQKRSCSIHTANSCQQCHLGRIKLNNSESTRVDFALFHCEYILIYLSQKPCTRYLGLHLDSKLNWHEHILQKRKMLDFLINSFQWLINRYSQISLKNKRLICTTIFRLAWSYGAEIWGTAAKSNTEILERFQYKFMRMITRAP